MKNHSLVSLSARLSRWTARRLGPVLLLCAAAASANAQAPRAAGNGDTAARVAPVDAVSIELTQAKVVRAADGKEQLLDAASVKPGDVLQYRAVYTNRSNKPVNGIVATLPVPPGLEYLANSAAPLTPRPQAATDNGVYGAEPLMHAIAGKTLAVPMADYRALRWNLGSLPPKGQAVVSLRAIVPAVASHTPASAAALSSPALPLAPPAIRPSMQ